MFVLRVCSMFRVLSKDARLCHRASVLLQRDTLSSDIYTALHRLALSYKSTLLHLRRMGNLVAL